MDTSPHETPVRLQELMDQSGVQFGTSGARGLAEALTDRVTYAYTTAFLQYLQTTGQVPPARSPVAVAGDLRPSTGRILEAVCRAVEDHGGQALNCGRIPSPAVALHGLARGIPAIMVTGSHIPDDRNGIKFNKPAGEILKPDEALIRQQVVLLDERHFDTRGAFTSRSPGSRPVAADARYAYRQRYLDFLPARCLEGSRLAVYQHSAVGRDELVVILQALGAEVTPVGRSDSFIPVDTEAIRPEDAELARHWAAELEVDAVVSTDGDSDRPLISDEAGVWLRGDVAGILCARFLDATSISLPVSCNTAVERCGWFPEVRRTRIGSPFVIESMQAASAAGARVAVGYEANGGFLLNSDITRDGKRLAALPTRDAVIVLLGVLLLARQQGKTVSQLAAELPPRFTASDRLKAFAPERSRAILQRFSTGDPARDAAAAEALFGNLAGAVTAIDRTDGIRLSFDTGDIIHLRPSGNAPEFRCYTESDTTERAEALNTACLRQVAAAAP